MLIAAFKIKTVAFFAAAGFRRSAGKFPACLSGCTEIPRLRARTIRRSRRRRDAKQMRLHQRVAPRQQFHAHAGAGVQNFALGLASRGPDSLPTDQTAQECSCGKIAPVVRNVATDALICSRSSALRNPTETPAARATCESEYPLRKRMRRKRAPTGLALGRVIRGGKHALFSQQMHNRRSVQSARAAQKLRALQDAHVALRVEPVLTACPLRRNQSQRLPGPQYRRRNTHHLRHVADAQVSVGRLALRGALPRASAIQFPLDNLRAFF